MKQRFAWFSDVHLGLTALPSFKRMFIARLNDANVDGLFLTGDISTGILIESNLIYLARKFEKPIYFVLGNHDYFGRHTNSVHSDVKRICSEHPNMHWMTDSGVLELNEYVAVVGTEGWFDAVGDTRALRWTFDWFMTLDFLQLDGMPERIVRWREMASASATLVAKNLRQALKTHGEVYVLTHFPPWLDATVLTGSFTERLRASYNTNTVMGRAIEEVMREHPDQKVTVLSGHTHAPCHLQVRDNVECHVARANYRGRIRPEETIII